MFYTDYAGISLQHEENPFSIGNFTVLFLAERANRTHLNAYGIDKNSEYL
jgi:hypothetical protein